MKVLLIEDNNDICYCVNQYLQDDYGIETIIAKTGAQAYNILAKSKKSEFDYIIVDIKLPDENGVEIIKYIKKFFTTKIIIFTICIIEDYCDKCQYDYFFVKGVNKVQDFTDIIISDFLSKYK